MPAETDSLFTRAIEDHLELKERNARLEASMPLGRYKDDDPFHNHPLFKTEEQARLEETMDGQEPVPVEAHVAAWPGEETVEHVSPELDKRVDALADRVATVFEEGDLEWLERSVEMEDEPGVFGALRVAPAEWRTLVDRAERLANEHRSELRRGSHDR